MTSRILVVARRFWPACDEASCRLLEWTGMLQKEGVAVTVLTGRWHNSWPAELTCREVRIVRILPAPRSSWTETLFQRNLAAWITKHRQDFDKIYMDESTAMLKQISNRSVVADLPIVAKFQGLIAKDSEFPIPLSSITQACDGCRRATAVVAPSPFAQRQLLSSGIPADKIIRIPDVAWYPVLRDPKLKQDAARALRKVNHDFTLPQDFKLLIYLGELSDSSAIRTLLWALFRVFAHQPKLRVWIVGSGRDLPDFYDYVKRECLHHDILFQCPFDDLESLLQIGDALILPESDSGSQYYLPHALTTGMPVIATEASLVRHAMPTILHAKLAKRQTVEDLYRSITDWYENSAEWNGIAEKARQMLVSENALEDAKQLWLNLLMN
jgi:glycosyltransferase involved in cell wall biosynthesis